MIKNNKQSKLTTQTQCSDTEQESIQDVVFKSLSESEELNLRGGGFKYIDGNAGGGTARIRWNPK